MKPILTLIIFIILSSHHAYSNDIADSDAIRWLVTRATNHIDVQAPTIPNNLITTEVSSSQINLSWSASSDNTAVTGYYIYQNGIFIKSTDRTSILITGLYTKTNYCFTVSAIDAENNESNQGSQLCATTPKATPFDNHHAFNGITNSTFALSSCTNLPLETAVGIFVSPAGTPTATGTQLDPLDLATALSSTSIVTAGETIWLMEGIYKGNFTSKLRGTSLLPIKVKPLPGKRAIIDGNHISGGAALTISGDWADYYGLEVISSSATHTSAQTGSNPSDLVTNNGVTVTGPNTRVINFIVHDNVGGGISSWSNAPNSELYGNIIYNNGWTGPDRGHGHAIYAQNNTGFKKLTNNIIFFGYGTGIHVYTEGGQMNNFDVQHNTWFMTGASDPRASQKKDNCLIGGFKPVTNLLMKNNLGYSENSRGIRLGYGGSVVGQDAILMDNYLSENFWVAGSWSSLNVSNSAVFRGLTGVASSFISDGTNGNIVQITPPATGNQVFVKANDHDPRRARVVIYNHEDAPSVSVDLSSVLKSGEAYRIHSSFALFDAPMIEGVFDGNPVSIPMGSVVPPQPTGSNGIADEDYPHRKFGVFIVTHGGC